MTTRYLRMSGSERLTVNEAVELLRAADVMLGLCTSHDEKLDLYDRKKARLGAAMAGASKIDRAINEQRARARRLEEERRKLG